MKPRHIFLRGGGLGDFILTLPLLELAHLQKHPVTLYARSQYLRLLGNEFNWLETEDLDELCGNPPRGIRGSRAISFWLDSMWSSEMINAGALSALSINPRPSNGKHFVIQACEKIGWQIPNDFLKKSFLQDSWKGHESTLWIHPGSAGLNKNLPLLFFISRAQNWLKSDGHKKVIFSFGEADDHLLEKFMSTMISRAPRVFIVRLLDVMDLRNQLSTRADRFIGNDSGPGHLAASLGIPVEIYFSKTDSSVWHPLGPRVKIYCFDSDSNKIL